MQIHDFMQFRKWFDDALTAGLHEPNAMALSTANKDGKPYTAFLLRRFFFFFVLFLRNRILYIHLMFHHMMHTAPHFVHVITK